MFKLASFEKLLDKATSNLRLEPDWPTILVLCDMIRQGDVGAKDALASIRKRIAHANPHSSMYALQILESCVKNCGTLVHDEVASKVFMEQFKETISGCQHENVKNKMLEMLQTWAYAFRNNAKYRAVQDMVNIMKAGGFKFPAMKESDAMFMADTAPDWEDGDCCHRCRVTFTLLQRKHHCRACGQVFCASCSSHVSTIPKFGIEKEVRVCDSCFEKQTKTTNSGVSGNEKQQQVVKDTTAANTDKKKSEEELREEEELQLALALSQSEAECQKNKNSTSFKDYSKTSKPYENLKKSLDKPDDPELAHYLNRKYWENVSSSTPPPPAGSKSTAPRLVSTADLETAFARKMTLREAGMEEDVSMLGVIASMGRDALEDEEISEFMDALHSQVEIFVNRMKSNSSRGRSIANDSSVQTLFLNITAMHSKLLNYIQQQDDKRVHFEALQDKLTQVRDARAALDALREEHREKIRLEAEIAERQRQMLMAQKLEIMRQKKQEYLQYQRELALQRIHDQERELHMRQEQQKQQYRFNAAAYGSLPPYMSVPGGMAFEPVVGGVSGPPTSSQYGHQGMPPTSNLNMFPSHYSQVHPNDNGMMGPHSMPPPPPPPGGMMMPPPGSSTMPPLQMGQYAQAPQQMMTTHPSQQISHPYGVSGGVIPQQQSIATVNATSTPQRIPQGTPSPSISTSSSDHSQRPMPSAPSVCSTTSLPDEKESVGELISFD